MANRPSLYTKLCLHVMKKAKAQGAMVIIVEGTNGNGFALKGSPFVHQVMPAFLRRLADGLEKKMSTQGILVDKEDRLDILSE